MSYSIPQSGRWTSSYSLLAFMAELKGMTADTDPSSQPMVPSGMSAEDIRARSVHQQMQRLRLLQHAMQCRHVPCPKSRHCQEMKDLWRHILLGGCDRSACDVPHCKSSKLVLQHYLRCRHPHCEVCSPIRTADDGGILRAILMDCFLR